MTMLFSSADMVSRSSLAILSSVVARAAAKLSAFVRLTVWVFSAVAFCCLFRATISTRVCLWMVGSCRRITDGEYLFFTLNGISLTPLLAAGSFICHADYILALFSSNITSNFQLTHSNIRTKTYGSRTGQTKIGLIVEYVPDKGVLLLSDFGFHTVGPVRSTKKAVV